MTSENKCVVCGNPIPEGSRTIFCSPECKRQRQIAYKHKWYSTHKATKKCAYCGQEITRPFSKVYCSETCYYEASKANRRAKRAENRPPITNKITIERMKKGWTQSQLAEAVGVQANQINAWENDRANPKVKSLMLIAEALQVPLSALLDDSTD